MHPPHFRNFRRTLRRICAALDTIPQTVFARQPASIAPVSDEQFIEGIGQDEFGFSRAVAAVGTFIHPGACSRRWAKGPNPPAIDHQGIDDAFVEKASVVRYFHRGRWLELAGAD